MGKKYAVRILTANDEMKVIVVKAITMNRAIKMVENKLTKAGQTDYKICSCVPV